MEKDTHKRILVTGATGKQGGAVVAALLPRTFSLRALVRDPQKKEANELAKHGVDIVQGDLDEPATVHRALTGVDGVFSVQPFIPRGMDSEVRRGTLLAELAKQMGVSHFVYASVCGANRHSGVPHFETKWRIEQRIRELALPYTILRPVFFMQNWLDQRRNIEEQGMVRLPLTPDRKLQQIDVCDIGLIAARAFESPSEWIGREIDLAGDEVEMSEVAGAAAECLGRPVHYEQIPWDRFRWDAGEEMTRMFQWLQDVGYHVDIASVRKLHPELVSLHEFFASRVWREVLNARRRTG